MDRMDLAILHSLWVDHEAVTGMSAVTQRTIFEKIGISESTLHRRLSHIVAVGYAAKGFSEDRCLTYYITQEGINLLEEALT